MSFLDYIGSDLISSGGSCQTSSICGFNRLLGSSSSGLASALVLLSSSNFQPVDSFISFISLQSSYAWYMKLSQFETVFLGLLMLQVSVLRYLEVLPINVNNYFLGDPTGRRRKKRSFWKTNDFNCEQDPLIQSLFKVLKNLDDGRCLARTLCELESMSNESSPPARFPLGLPEETSQLLQALKTSANYREKSGNVLSHRDQTEVEQGNIKSYCKSLDGLQTYEDAVLLGTSAYYPNSTFCEDRYSACALTKEDIEEYIGILIDANIL